MPQIPKEIVFVDNFPTTSTGKILKSELKNV
jgi:acyl-coenzyme A synthetase/AMP-(fatty) acid ligase